MEARKARYTYFKAVSDGDIEKVKEILLKQEVDVNAENAFGVTPLHWAILSPESGIEVPKFLVENGADVNEEPDESSKSTLLHFASIEGRKRIVDLLLENGADVNAKDNNGHTPLHWVLRSEQTSNHVKVVKILLENGVYINAPNSDGQTPLHTAVSKRFTSAIKILLEHKADVNAVDKNGKTPLHYASHDSTSISDTIVILRLLLQYGADVNAVDKRGETPLHKVIRQFSAYDKNDQLKIESLIQYGADVNIHDINGLTPLHKAVRWGTLKIVMALLDAGADVKNEEGKKALILQLIGLKSWNLHVVHKVNPVRTHVISLKVAGLYVNELYIQALATLSDQSVHSFVYERFEKKCRRELEIMLHIELKSNFSLMYVLTTNNPRYVRNQALMQQLESIEYYYFPIYGKMLKRKLETDKKKLLLFEESKVSLEKLIKKDERTRHLFIPSELLEKIFCHLSCCDLRNLVTCAQVQRRSIEAG